MTFTHSSTGAPNLGRHFTVRNHSRAGTSSVSAGYVTHNSRGDPIVHGQPTTAGLLAALAPKGHPQPMSFDDECWQVARAAEIRTNVAESGVGP